MELRACFVVNRTSVKMTFGFADEIKDRTLLLSSESENRTWGSKIRKSIRGEWVFTLQQCTATRGMCGKPNLRAAQMEVNY